MTFSTSTAGRLVRPAVALLLLLLVVPARGAGTGGIDISPYPGTVDGRQITAFHVSVPSRGSSSVQYALRNTTDKPATARLFASSAARKGGSFTLGVSGSSPYLSFKDQTVTLKPKETRIAEFSVHPGPHGRPAREAYGALVVEVKNGSIIQQAATVVYLKPGRLVPLPLLIVLIAVGVLVLAGLGFLISVRRRR